MKMEAGRLTLVDETLQKKKKYATRGEDGNGTQRKTKKKNGK